MAIFIYRFIYSHKQCHGSIEQIEWWDSFMRAKGYLHRFFGDITVEFLAFLWSINCICINQKWFNRICLVHTYQFRSPIKEDRFCKQLLLFLQQPIDFGLWVITYSVTCEAYCMFVFGSLLILSVLTMFIFCTELHSFNVAIIIRCATIYLFWLFCIYIIYKWSNE